jgi:RHS repeat-associated protein
MADKSASSNEIISLPKGGGALKGIGETFSPDLHTGTGNFTIPITVPPGRNSFQPQLNLVYSTGNGNGLFGLGWNLSIPGITRKTSKGIPAYRDYDDDLSKRDTFVLSGAEDLVPVDDESETATRYQPRTEGLFARIVHHHSADDYWEVNSKDGLTSFYGTPAPDDPAVIRKLNNNDIFAWKLSLTKDPFGNRIEYLYTERDQGLEINDGHQWDQPLLKNIRYADYEDAGETRFLILLTFFYETRPDPFSEYRAGFEIRTSKRCKAILIQTDADQLRSTRRYDFDYRNDFVNGVSRLTSVRVVGFDDAGAEHRELPPLEFDYTDFRPEDQRRRDFYPVQGADLPTASLANSSMELVDLFGNGLPDLIEMNGAIRYWRNCGNGRFALPRMMNEAPGGIALSDAGVQLIDANGDGRIDLLVTQNGSSGYYPIKFDGSWDRRSFQKYRYAPTFNLKDPEVRLLDLTGDGVIDVLRSGTRFECFFNNPREGWSPHSMRWTERAGNVNFSDPRTKLADMTGDNLQDIVLVHDGNVEYWPNLGYGSWGKRLHMSNSPRFAVGYDPKRILIGDVDGDGLADIVYVEDRKVTLWINQSGNRWSDPIEIVGTPPASDMDAVRLVDLLGNGISGVLWTSDAAVDHRRPHYFFLDLTGGTKPYLLHQMNNHMGAVTRVGYAPSTRYYLEDQKRPETAWKTTLPFPVQVVSRVEVIDEISGGKLTTEYRYHNGYWDGAEREFRGFGMVEQFDTESFDDYGKRGLHGDASFNNVERKYFSDPALTKTWFHQGPIGEEFGEWQEQDYSGQYWQGDPQLLNHTQLKSFLQTFAQRRVKRDALRALRGSVLRTELYALDNTERASIPYSVTEYSYHLREEHAGVFFPHRTGERMTQWERGDDPLVQFNFTGRYDEFGQALSQTSVAMPRRSRKRIQLSTNEVADETSILVTHTRTAYAEPKPGVYIHNRIAHVTSFTLAQKRSVVESRPADVAAVLSDYASAASRVHAEIETALVQWQPEQGEPAQYRIFAHTVNNYDGVAYEGEPVGQLGNYGSLTRSDSLIFTGDILNTAYDVRRPAYLGGSATLPAGAPSNFGADHGYVDRTNEAGYVPGYYVAASQQRFDFQTNGNTNPRGLVMATRDARNNESSITDYLCGVLPVSVKDAAGLETKATYNLRVLQPSRVTEPNGNFSETEFSPLGLVTAIWLKGKNGEGDQTRASKSLQYDFLAFDTRGDPVVVRTIQHVHHDTETAVSPTELNFTIDTCEYSDGFGRLLQTRTQGEEVRFGDQTFGGGEEVLPAKQSDGRGSPVVGSENTSTNVVVSGWQVYDNKGRVVEKYEPFFSAGWDYARATDTERGRKATMFYDPRGMVVRTTNADGSEQRIVYGTPANLDEPSVFNPTPWETYSYDVNDNAGRTHAPTSQTYRHHHNTPSSILIDALGRTLMTVERNRDTATDPLPATDEYRTRSTYDIQGNVLTIVDALGRTAFSHLYDLLKQPLKSQSIDAGDRWLIQDAAGNLIEAHDSKRAVVLTIYDVLNRPTRMWARDNDSEPLTQRTQIIYGDELSPAQALANNLRGKPFKQYDEAGVLTFTKYDFKGNVVEKSRQVIGDDVLLGPFNPAPANWAVKVFRANWQPPPNTSLETHASTVLDATVYETSIAYDALNRVKTMQYPRDVSGARQELRPHYNRSGALERVELDGDTYVERIAYTANGQRTLIAYGNGVMTRYAYDPSTFRLLRLRTEQFTKQGAQTYTPTGTVFQDLAYEYDLAGNVLRIHDRTPASGIQNTQLGDDALDRVFHYDAVYRLLSATGRECDLPPSNQPWTTQPRGTDLTLARPYTQTFQYDAAGNMTNLKHEHIQTGGNALVSNRQFALVQNRLATVTLGANVYAYGYDDNGNLMQENTERHFDWDHADRLRVFRNQVSGSRPSIHAQYLYDVNGQRVKKFVVSQQGEIEATVYIDGLFEHHIRATDQAGVVQNNTLHVIDNQSRVVTVRVGAAFPDDGAAAVTVKYHLGDHLGSSNIIIGGATSAANTFVNREEYTPYGETSFGSFARKRYRFTAKERDDESGLSYHGARYYAPWLARWTSCDPLGQQAGINAYAYGRDNPVTHFDPEGKQAETPQTVAGEQIIDPDAEWELPDALKKPQVHAEEREAGSQTITQPSVAEEALLSVSGLDKVVDRFRRQEPAKENIEHRDVKSLTPPPLVSTPEDAVEGAYDEPHKTPRFSGTRYTVGNDYYEMEVFEKVPVLNPETREIEQRDMYVTRRFPMAQSDEPDIESRKRAATDSIILTTIFAVIGFVFGALLGLATGGLGSALLFAAWGAAVGAGLIASIVAFAGLLTVTEDLVPKKDEEEPEEIKNAKLAADYQL